MKNKTDNINETKMQNLNNEILEYEARIAQYHFKIEKLERKIKELKEWN
jgi:hypothetical protein